MLYLLAFGLASEVYVLVYKVKVICYIVILYCYTYSVFNKEQRKVILDWTLDNKFQFLV